MSGLITKIRKWKKMKKKCYLLHRRRLSRLQSILQSSCDSRWRRKTLVVQKSVGHLFGWGSGSANRTRASVATRRRRRLPRSFGFGQLDGVFGSESRGRIDFFSWRTRRSRVGRSPWKVLRLESAIRIDGRSGSASSVFSARRRRSFQTRNVVSVDATWKIKIKQINKLNSKFLN